MSTMIAWEPVTSGGTICAGCQRVKEALETAFGALPCEVGQPNIPMLQAMAAVFSGDDNPYSKIIELIESHGWIRLCAEY